MYCVKPVTKLLSIPFLTIDCVQSVTKRLNARLWRSDVSNQWQNVSILLLWRSTVSNQWPKHLRTPSLTIDCLQPVTKLLSTPFSDDLMCLTSNQHSSLTIYCVQSVVKRLSIPLWRSTVIIFYWLSFGTKPLSVTFPDIQWRIWRNGWHYFKRSLCKGQGHLFWHQWILHIRLPIGCQ